MLWHGINVSQDSQELLIEEADALGEDDIAMVGEGDIPMIGEGDVVIEDFAMDEGMEVPFELETVEFDSLSGVIDDGAAEWT
jgi:hypothetical protein